MLKEQFNDLQVSIQSLEEGLDGLNAALHEILTMQDKSFTIAFKGKIYDFHPATTDKERVIMFSLAESFIQRFLIHVISKNIRARNKPKYGWDDVLSFATGPDPKDYQFERINREDLYEISDENGDKITSLPLNIDSTYVKMQNPNS